MATAAPTRSTADQLAVSAKRLAGIVLCDDRTAKKWLCHESVRRPTAAALEKAAKQLGIKREPLAATEKTG